MQTRVCITIDVEPSVAGAFEPASAHSPLLHEPVAGPVRGRSEGLGFLLRTFAEFGLTATFFIEALHTAYFDEREMGGYVDDVLRQGHDVQLHVHPLWRTFKIQPRDLSQRVSDECAEHSQERLAEFLSLGRAQLERWTGATPVAVRTGSFSTSRAVFLAMSQAGLKASSNICVGHAPPREPKLRLPGGVHRIEGAYEFPVTCFRDRGPIGRSRFRGLQVTACAQWEMQALLDCAHRIGYPYLVFVTHPFEFIKKDSPRYSKLTVNRINQSRLRWLARFLAENTDRFEVTTMLNLAHEAPIRLNETLPELSSGPVPSLMRSAQNGLNDRIWAL